MNSIERGQRSSRLCVVFFFQAEDGIRDGRVTGVQTCALPICGQVNIVTRSGGDEFHGVLFEFVRNDAFNANSFLNNANKPLGVNEDGKAKKAPDRKSVV